MTTSTVRGSYAKSAAVKNRIIEACIDAFAETGFYGATMKDIAKRAGISYTGLLHHFPRKEDLLLAVLELRLDRDQEFLAGANALDAQANPLNVFRGMLDVIVQNELRPGLLELHCVVSGEATSPEHPAHEHYVTHYRNLRQFYTQAFMTLSAHGELGVEVDPQALATMTISLLNGLQAQWLFDRDAVAMEETFRTFLGVAVPALGR